MLHIFQSNRLEPLADALLARMDTAGDGDPLAAEVVIVPSRALERWLSWRIADRLGVCADVQFRFAAAFIWESFARVLPGVPDRSPFDSDVTALRLFSHLGQLPPQEDFAPLAAWLAGNDESRRMELGRRLADLYAQYMIHRPDWLERWAAGARVGLEPGATERWQHALWQWLQGTVGLAGLRHPKEEFFAALARGGAGHETWLPRRIRIFALPGLPPLYAEIFAQLARHIEVEWYSLNPCRQFWADITSEKRQARKLVSGEAGAALLDVGHPLLASWGDQSRAQLSLIAAHIGEDGSQDHECFVDSDGATLLGRLQQSILDLAEPDPLAVHASDRSLQVHACHSLTREVEVLHDQLLALFDALPDLEASEVAVFTPDLDAAAPVIDAVFGSAPAQRHIPYTITGRARPDGTPLLRAVEFLLGLPRCRFEAARVLGFLEIPAVARRYALDAADLATIQRWLHEAGLRWGLDAAHRESLDLPGETRHSWQETLYRLLLGYAMPGHGAALFQNLLPYDELEGSQALTLGKLLRVLIDLRGAHAAFSERRRLVDWPGVVLRQLGLLLDPAPEDSADDERLRAALADLARDARSAAAEDLVGIGLVRTLLDARLQSAAPGAVPAGQVTFAGIGPLRGLPYRVICLLGLDDDAFPRRPAPLEFDLMKARPRPGDRSRRDEDRGAFLDGLLAARDVFYLSYTGRSIRDNAPLPPSVLIAELLDYLGRYADGGRAAIAGRLLTEHPLQPFSARYFGGGPLFSYASELVPAAQAAGKGFHEREPRRALFAGALPEALPADTQRVDLDTLQRFFRHPVRHLLRTRLGIRIFEADEEIPVDEPFTLERREGWNLQDQMLERRLAGHSMKECLALAQASPSLPHGQWGRQQLHALADEVDAFAAQVAAARSAPLRDPHAFEVNLGAFTLGGVLDRLADDGLLLYALRKDGASDLLGAWLAHLALCCARPEGVALRTRVLLRDRQYQFDAVADAPHLLAELLGHYRDGLQSPLPFFPKSAFKLLTARDPGQGLARAESCWIGGSKQPGERADSWYRLAFGGEPDELADGFEGFEACARAILGPPLAARRDLVTQAAPADAA